MMTSELELRFFFHIIIKFLLKTNILFYRYKITPAKKDSELGSPLDTYDPFAGRDTDQATT